MFTVLILFWIDNSSMIDINCAFSFIFIFFALFLEVKIFQYLFFIFPYKQFVYLDLSRIIWSLSWEKGLWSILGTAKARSDCIYFSFLSGPSISKYRVIGYYKIYCQMSKTLIRLCSWVLLTQSQGVRFASHRGMTSVSDLKHFIAHKLSLSSLSFLSLTNTVLKET